MMVTTDNKGLESLPCYVLTIDKEGGQRIAHCRSQLESLPMGWDFCQGYTPDSLQVSLEYSRWRNWLSMKRSMTKGEIAVYLGHRSIWQRMIDSHQSVALVMEDDFKIVDSAKLLSGIGDALACSDRWDVAKFFDYRPKRAVSEMKLGDSVFVAHKHPTSGLVAYLVQARAANKLLRRKRIFRPVDEDMSYPWEHALRIWSMVPNPIIENAEGLGGSLLEKERFRKRRLQRAWYRSLYGVALTMHKECRGWLWRRSLYNTP
jgi:glycosyl transferase, family 25